MIRLRPDGTEKAAAKKPKEAPVPKPARTADAIVPRIERAREAVASMPAPSVRFLMKIDQGLADRLEAERQRRGLRSRVATIVAVLDGGMK